MSMSRAIIQVARDVLDGDDIHPEYQRAVVELTTQLLERPMSDARLVAYAIGARNPEQYDY
jgi:hypothetical protein